MCHLKLSAADAVCAVHTVCAVHAVCAVQADVVCAVHAELNVSLLSQLQQLVAGAACANGCCW